MNEPGSVVSILIQEGQGLQFLQHVSKLASVLKGYVAMRTRALLSFKRPEDAEMYLQQGSQFRGRYHQGAVKNSHKPPIDDAAIEKCLCVVKFETTSMGSEFLKYLKDLGGTAYLPLPHATLVQFETSAQATKAVNDKAYDCSLTLSAFKGRGKKLEYLGQETKTSENITINYITEPSDLHKALKIMDSQLSASKEQVQIGIDIEFDSFRFSKSFVLCLLQLHFGDHLTGTTYLLDGISLKEDIKLLKSILEHPNAVLIGFSLSCDLKLLSEYGITPAACNTIDLQKLKHFEGFNRGFSQLAFDELGVVLPKDEQCRNWVERPLGMAALKYAANDVIYLSTIYKNIVSRLSSPDVRFGSQILSWFAEELNWSGGGNNKSKSTEPAENSAPEPLPPPPPPPGSETAGSPTTVESPLLLDEPPVASPLVVSPKPEQVALSPLEQLVAQEVQERRNLAYSQRDDRVKCWFKLLHDLIAMRYSPGIAFCAASSRTFSELCRNKIPDLPPYRIMLVREAAESKPIFNIEKYLTECGPCGYLSSKREEYDGL
eukprot:TRINITY_DN1053_c1_g1_i1.p1 TRINITY_DN1053_c1_g1~~TRINITY_DN1053_c1_g1_i1.p1  ORF type:complete len:546 (+),score=82.11 TRINITY_DN1053_c1_g1_i1:51-1688(+)